MKKEEEKSLLACATHAQREKDALRRLYVLEDLAEKKTQIYAKLLTDAALSKALEELVERHAAHKRVLIEMAEEVAEQ